MQSTTKALPPDSSSTENVYDQGGGSGQLGLRAGGAKNFWFKQRHRKRVNRLKIVTYNVSAILRDDHIQEVEEELREIRLVSDVIRIGEVRRREKCFITLQSGHLLCNFKANNSQAGVGFFINRKSNNHTVRVNSIAALQNLLCA